MFFNWFCIFDIIGSTPRMWGNEGGLRLRARTTRFNPTHVGKWAVTTGGKIALAVQPHACGEMWVLKTASPLLHGSPHACGEMPSAFNSSPPDDGSTPRMWGNVHGAFRSDLHCRFNPTHVGKCQLDLSYQESPTVQPHACGEMRWWICWTWTDGGSTPRMWGNGPMFNQQIYGKRFNPTHVGKCWIYSCSNWGITVQPHACGEMYFRGFPLSAVFGSTPRMWGNVLSMQFVEVNLRFNPTHVGKWVAPSATFSLVPVQPHACGEMAGSTAQVFRNLGSTPRMWGNDLRLFFSLIELRFNPTHVGKWEKKKTFDEIMTVQPHACGEMARFVLKSINLFGSTPRMWGNVFVNTLIFERFRFNPTHVGKCLKVCIVF